MSTDTDDFDDLEFELYSAKTVKAAFTSNLKKIISEDLVSGSDESLKLAQKSAVPDMSKSEIKFNEDTDSKNNSYVEIDENISFNEQPGRLSDTIEVLEDTSEKNPYKVSRSVDIDFHNKEFTNRNTRSCELLETIEISEESTSGLRRSGRLRNSKRSMNTSRPVDFEILECTIESTSRQRGRNTGSVRGTRNRGRGRRNTRRRNFYPIPPDSPPLPEMVFGGFDNKPITVDFEDEIVEGGDLDMNENYTVKVLWKTTDIKRFSVRKFQKLSCVFDQLADLESVKPDQIILTLNGKLVHPHDTYASLDLQIYNIIDGGVLTKPRTGNITVDKSVTSVSEDDVLLKFQDSSKSIMSLCLKRTEKMKVVMVKYAEQNELSVSDFRFVFDGDDVDPNTTPESLELEGGEIIDVRCVL